MLTVPFLWSWEIMVIEKKYYDIAQRELEEMQREINEEKAPNVRRRDTRG